MFSQASISHSVHNGPHGYFVTAHPCYGVVGMHPTGMLSCSKCFQKSIALSNGKNTPSTESALKPQNPRTTVSMSSKYIPERKGREYQFSVSKWDKQAIINKTNAIA